LSTVHIAVEVVGGKVHRGWRDGAGELYTIPACHVRVKFERRELSDAELRHIVTELPERLCERCFKLPDAEAGA